MFLKDRRSRIDLYCHFTCTTNCRCSTPTVSGGRFNQASVSCLLCADWQRAMPWYLCCLWETWVERAMFLWFYCPAVLCCHGESWSCIYGFLKLESGLSSTQTLVRYLTCSRETLSVTLTLLCLCFCWHIHPIKSLLLWSDQLRGLEVQRAAHQL